MIETADSIRIYCDSCENPTHSWLPLQVPLGPCAERAEDWMERHREDNPGHTPRARRNYERQR